MTSFHRVTKRLTDLLPIALLLFAVPSLAYDGKHVNAKAVSVQAYHTNWFSSYSVCGAGDGLFDGAIILYTIEDAQVTGKTTIYDRSQGLATYAAFNLAGTKVAFYRRGYGQSESDGSCVEVNGGKSYISVINTDGSGLTNLCELPVLPEGGIFPLDWPAGDWIYYEMPHTTSFGNQGNTSMMVWRVNAVSGATEHVCNLTMDGSGTELHCTYMHRFSMNLKGDRMALMVYPKYGCDTEATFDANTVYHFPPAGCDLSGSSITRRAGCNISISPSGEQYGSYFAGWHDDLFLNNTDVTINTLESWAGEEIGNGAENIRWAVNSDKWVMQGIGNTGTGHASSNLNGCNQVVCNWIDQVAINISKNPASDPCAVDYLNSSCASQTPPSTLESSLIVNSGPGDMWIDDPANNPNGDRYEDLQGAWHTVDIATATSSHRRASRASGVGAEVIQGEHGLTVRLGVPAEVTITNIRGAVAAHFMASGIVPVRKLAPGQYCVSVDVGGVREVSRIVVR